MVGSCSEATGEEDDDELSDEEIALEIAGDEGTVDLDDADASDLDIGLKLPEPGESDDDASAQVDVDFSEMFGREHDVSEAGDDEAGPLDFDTSIGVQELDAEDLSDDALGLEGVDLVLDEGSSAAPTPDGDEEGALETLDLFIADESESEVAARPWNRFDAAAGDFEVVSSLGEFVVAAGADTCLLRGEASTRLELGAVASAVLFGHPDQPTLVVSTKLGELVELDPARDPKPRVLDWKGALHLNPRTPASITLCRLDDADSCLALSSTGSLLSVSPGFVQPVEIAARPVALPRAADRPFVLGESAGVLYVLDAPSWGGPWHAQPLPEAVTRIFRGTVIEICTQGSVVALGNRQDGIFVSCDGGRHFQPVAGTAASGALACGRFQGELMVWVVVSHEVSGLSDLLMIDPGRARAVRLARFETEDPREEAFAPVTTLAYDPTRESLYAAGAFGLLRLAVQSPE